MIVFVVLHYKNFEVTKTCIQYLLSLSKIDENKIIVVDNNSRNNSGQRLEQTYRNEENITFLFNEENLGFAKGNNVGYLYAKNNFEPKFIVVMNNDIFIKQSNFIEILTKEYKEDYQIIGPKIINKFDEPQNPFRYNLIDNNKLSKIHAYNLINSKIFKIPIINNFYLALIKYLKKLKSSRNSKQADIKISNNNKFTVLHGSCVIFAEHWIKENNFSFLPDTFMYFEEDILAEYAYDNGYKMSVINEIEVTHMEDASLESSFSVEIEKRKFLSKNMATSTKILIDMRKNKKINTVG